MVIVSYEHRTVTYWLQVVIDGAKLSQAGPVVLEHGDKWQQVVAFTPDKAGANQKVAFLLYRNGGSEAYLELYRWIDVIEAS